MDSGKVQVYCHMTDIPGCGGGGWTLVMKINGSKVQCSTCQCDAHLTSCVHSVYFLSFQLSVYSSQSLICLSRVISGLKSVRCVILKYAVFSISHCFFPCSTFHFLLISGLRLKILNTIIIIVLLYW